MVCVWLDRVSRQEGCCGVLWQHLRAVAAVVLPDGWHSPTPSTLSARTAALVWLLVVLDAKLSDPNNSFSPGA